MTLYRMYVENGDRANFWVQHRDWPNACALVLTVGGQTVGRLPGKTPAFDDAEVVVRRYDVRSGRPIGPADAVPDPGDKHFSAIATPAWSRRVGMPAAFGPAAATDEVAVEDAAADDVAADDDIVSHHPAT